MRMLWAFARAYPGRTAATLGFLWLAGLAEGIGLSSVLPVLSIAAGGAGSAESSAAERLMENLLGAVGLSPTLGVLVGVIIAGICLKGALVLLANVQVGYTVAHVATDLRIDLLRALLGTRWEFYIRQQLGGFANAVGTEALRASQSYLYGANAAALMVQVVVYVIVAFLVSWQATLAALAAGAVIVLILNALVHMTRRAGLRQTRLLRSLLGRITDGFAAVKPLKAMARETLVGPILEAETRGLNRALRKEVFSTGALQALQEPLLVIFLAGGFYAAFRLWGIPFASVMMLALLLGRTLASLGKVQRKLQAMAAGESAYWALQETIREARAAAERHPGTRAPALEKAIELRQVSFDYEGRPILRDAGMVIPAGQLTAVVGPSGAGKTTVADLVVGLLRPRSGEIYIDGVPLADIDLRAWRRMIGYVPQEMLLLHDTVRTNVTLGDAELTEADVEWALRAAGAWEFVQGLPEGLDSPVGERGTRLSGGQRQRIAIARALVHRPRLLIMDEATAALDPDTEAAIWRSVQALRGQVTILAISHQPALVQAADRIYRLEHYTLRRVEPMAAVAG